VKINKNRCWTLFFVALGYFGAAVFYSYLVGINLQIQTACPVCPHIDSLGTHLHKFVSRVMTLGTLNALLFILIGWTFTSLARFTKRIAFG
jgi:hypothetical protein